MTPIRIEGIILHSLDFQDFNQILTIFTKEHGLIKSIFKGKSHAKRKSGRVATPLIQAEFILIRGKGDLFTCQEISPVDQFIGVRKNITTLEVAFNLIHIVQNSQLPGKPSPSLYLLFLAYLKAVPVAIYPKALNCSFFLKLLSHEGHLCYSTCCSVCKQELTSQHLASGESFCKIHAPFEAISFNNEEIKQFQIFAFSRSIKEIYSINPSEIFEKKVKQLFKEVILLD